ncbi:META domain-containing protein [Rivibacter subsaxonicus]|uniref:Heat shock protein HslJ n=1 Tax=Rivibacter subsaxonicus TaxID=457575 RepID=A0A4V2FUP5_9BURK|nr:META domain-containing protein [Rivibacter subsaxonicus]RZU02776.1 heat shock protein HslJ [Rivibacter subsaxonicus]
MKKLILPFVAALAVAACSSTMGGKSAMLSLDKLKGTSWVASEVDPGRSDGRKPTVVFGAKDAPEVTGFGGCNNFFGGARMDGDKLKIGPLAQSMMMCEDGAMKAERTMHQKLDATRGARMDGDKLLLVDEAGAVLLRLSPAK